MSSKVRGLRGPEITEIGATTAAAGSTTTDAAVLPSTGHNCFPVTGANNAKGVRINAADIAMGRTIKIANLTAGILKMYPPTGGTIAGGATDAAYSGHSGQGTIVMCTDAVNNTWAVWS